MRKNLVIAAVVATLSLPVMADTPSEKQPSVAMQICTSYSELAKSVMESRHVGVGLPKMLEIADDDEVAVAIVMEAFDHPQFRTEQAIKRSAREFANQQMLGCMKAFNK